MHLPHLPGAMHYYRSLWNFGHDSQGLEGDDLAAPRAPAPALQVAKALVSWIGWKGVLWGLWYVCTDPVWVSVTVMSTLTLVRPPANTQSF